MSKSDGYFTQEIVFSIRTEFECYVRAMAAAAAEQIMCERERSAQTQPEQEPKNERRKNRSECVDSVRLCAL